MMESVGASQTMKAPGASECIAAALRSRFSLLKWSVLSPCFDHIIFVLLGSSLDYFLEIQN